MELFPGPAGVIRPVLCLYVDDIQKSRFMYYGPAQVAKEGMVLI